MVEGVSRDKTEWVKLSGRKWGVLEGGYLRRDIHESLAETHDPGIFMNWYKKWLSRWKLSRTVWRVSTHTRNVLTNVILNDLGGLSPMRADLYLKSVGLMRRHAKGTLTKTEQKLIDDTPRS